MTEATRAAYDAVARAYDCAYRDELAAKPLDRGLFHAFVDMVDDGPIADLGCGPGHVTRFLADRGADVIGIDLSPRMVQVARERSPDLAFAAGSMLELPVADHALSGAIALYSVIHLTPAERERAYGEIARTVRPGGWLLVSFHIDSPEFAAGAVNHVSSWFGEDVSLDGFFLEPDAEIRGIEAAGFSVASTTTRMPCNDAEYPSRRCYVIARRS